MRKTMNRTMLAAMVTVLANSAPRNLAEPWKIKRYDTGPMPVLSREKYDRAEAKRARKAQIKRNGGRK